ncbi:MAG: hypothetical protein IJW46_01615 [Clostridia bacterium]|nr:hypothetical protein [Clostridia bacterium]
MKPETILKKSLSILLVFLMLCPLLLLSSCSTNRILCETDSYIIEHRDGACFLNFKEGNQKDSLSIGGCIVYDERIQFDSAEAMKDTLLNGTLEEDQLFTIRNFFPRNEDDSIILPDPEAILLPALPDSHFLYRISLYGDSYLYTIRKSKAPEDVSPFYESAHFYIIDKDEYDERLAFHDRFLKEDTSAFPELCAIATDEEGLRIFEYMTASGKIRHLQYMFREEGKTVYVDESYRIEGSEAYPNAIVSETDPLEIRFTGVDGSHYFYCSMGTDIKPTADWYLAFGVTSPN